MRGRVVVIVVMLLSVGAAYGAYRAVAATALLAAELRDVTRFARLTSMPQATIVFDRTGRPAFSFFVEQRIAVPLRAVSPHMVHAIVAVEDRRFFLHRGVDPIGIAAAAWTNLHAGRIIQGGSTITQQLARVAQLSAERTYGRKIREVLLAARLEERYSKQEILQEYLNRVYFGEGFYGVEAAARGYFAKSASDLSPAEAALLAALVRSPSKDAPCIAPDRAKRRRNLVLRLMRDQGYLDDEQFRRSLLAATPDRSHAELLTASTTAGGDGQYFQEEVRRQLVALFGPDRVLRGGLRVHSTYDSRLQRAAEDAISSQIAQITKRRRNARDLQGSLVAIEPQSGDVLALVGGRDFRESPFNRATQARRQAGSAFKPIIYAAALERGYAPGSVLTELDAPIHMADGTWLPSGEHEGTRYTLRRALKVSSNRAAAQLLQQLGVTTAVYYAQRMGIESDLPMVPSLALGTGEVTLLELTAAYGAFANRGTVSHPRLITRVEDANGAILWTAPLRQTQAITPTTAYLMSSMLSDVVSGGTASGARSAGFKLPAAGKTGTTDDYSDAWFVGYTPRLVAGVWFGFDRPAPIMTRGFAGIVAVPAWARFMRTATAGAKPEWFEMPPDIEKVAICRLSGGRATPACRHAAANAVPSAVALGTIAAPDIDANAVNAAPETIAGVEEDLFPIGSAPTEACWIHSSSAMHLDIASEGFTTPTVDAILRATVSERERSAALRRAGLQPVANRTKLVMDRRMQADGTVKIVLRQE